MLSLKCDHPFLCEFPILFSTVKLNVGLGLSILPSFFPIDKKDGKLGFLKSIACTATFFPIPLEF